MSSNCTAEKIARAKDALRLTDMMSSIKTRIEIKQKDRHNG